LDPSSTQHAASVDEQGVLHYFHFDTANKASSNLLSFQLQLKGPEPDAVPEPIRQPWSFEFVPGLPGEIMLVQAGSCRILYASLPRQGTQASDVFLFGSHSGRMQHRGDALLLLYIARYGYGSNSSSSALACSMLLPWHEACCLEMSRMRIRMLAHITVLSCAYFHSGTI
jgi:hypothetical protein